MRPETLARTGLTALVAALLVLGVFSVGGPGTGRMERHDAERLSDLRALESWLVCMANAQGGMPPATLDPAQACRGTYRRNDPYTGTPYRYERVSDTSWRLCAAFEAPQRLGNVPGFDADSGCLSGSLPR
jgi:hypothetical protein